MRKLKLLYVTTVDLSKQKGATHHTKGMVQGLRRDQWDITLVSGAYGDRKRKYRDTAGRHHVVWARKTNVLYQLLWQIRFLRRISLKKATPDIIYVRAGKSLFVPQLLAIWHGIPFVMEINTLIEMETNPKYRVLMPLAVMMENIMLRKATAVFPVTHELKRYLVRRSFSPPEKFTVISNGCSANLCQMGKERAPNPWKRQVIGFLGSFEPWQGVETVLKAMPRVLEAYPEARFLIGGQGAMEASYRSIVAELGIEKNIVFTGPVPAHGFTEFLQQCSLMVVPRISAFEQDRIERHVGASPIKLFMALGYGKIVIASRLASMAFFGKCPSVCFASAGDPESWAEMIKHVFSLPEKTRSNLETSGRQFIEEGYTWEVLAEKSGRIMRSTLH